MPRRPQRPCRKCKRLHRNKSGYCDEHKELSKWAKWTEKKGNERERGYDWAWRKLTRRIRVRDKNLCQPCFKQGRLSEASAVDHIKPKAQGGTDDDENLQCICKVCHESKTARE